MQWRGEAWSWSREAARPCCRVSRVVLSNHGTGKQGVMRTCSLSNWEAKAALLIIQDFKLDYMAHLRSAWNTQDLISKNNNSNKAKIKQNKIQMVNGKYRQLGPFPASQCSSADDCGGWNGWMDRWMTCVASGRTLLS